MLIKCKLIWSHVIRPDLGGVFGSAKFDQPQIEVRERNEKIFENSDILKRLTFKNFSENSENSKD